MQVPPRIAFLILGSVLVVGVSALLYVGFAPRMSSDPPLPDALLMGPGKMAALPDGDYPKGALPVGSAAPSLQAEGWLNGQPPVQYADAPQLLLVDIWAHW